MLGDHIFKWLFMLGDHIFKWICGEIVKLNFGVVIERYDLDSDNFFLYFDIDVEIKDG